MALHPDQMILGAVQLGRCASLDDTNPYEPKDKKRYFGWQQGHESAIEEYRQQQKYNNAPSFRKILCKIGWHKYSLKHIPGRPHIDPKTSNIDRRDPIIEKYTCVYCNDVYFTGLRNKISDNKLRRTNVAKRRQR